MTQPSTIGELRASGYPDRTVKEELRENLLAKLERGEELFPGIVGFDESVLPALERGILAGHDLILLGERGQAKTRLVRAIVDLLDESDPRDRRVRDQRPPVPADLRALPGAAWPSEGDASPIGWIARDDRYAEKLATPGHVRRRPDRRRRPDPGGRGPLPRRRAHDPLRPDPADEPRHRGHQRAARPPRADPGGAVQHPGGARRPDPRLPDPAAARPAAGRHGEPRRLHAPRAHRVAAEGPVRHAGPHALPARRSATRSGSWTRRRARPAGDHPGAGPGVHEGGRGGAHGRAPAIAAREPPQRCQRPVLDRQPRDARRPPPSGAPRAPASPRPCRASCDLPAVLASSQGRVEFDTIEEGREEEILSRAMRTAELEVFRRRLSGFDFQPLLRAVRSRASPRRPPT